MDKAILYVHGKGGNGSEADQYKPVLKGYDVFGIDFDDFTPWGTNDKLRGEFKKLRDKYSSVSIIGNSIGAYFSMLALQGYNIEKAFFISPVLNMEKLISDMMKWANITEDELFERKTVHTDFGEDLSWDYLTYVRDHPITWDIPTEILYAETDELISRDTVDEFVSTHNARLTVFPGGEHWFHTPEELDFLYSWLTVAESKNAL